MRSTFGSSFRYSWFEVLPRFSHEHSSHLCLSSAWQLKLVFRCMLSLTSNFHLPTVQRLGDVQETVNCRLKVDTYHKPRRFSLSSKIDAKDSRANWIQYHMAMNTQVYRSVHLLNVPAVTVSTWCDEIQFTRKPKFMVHTIKYTSQGDTVRSLDWLLEGVETQPFDTGPPLHGLRPSKKTSAWTWNLEVSGYECT